MDEDECDSSIIRLFLSVTDITSKLNVVKWWIVGIIVCISIWTLLINLLLLSYIEGLQTL